MPLISRLSFVDITIIHSICKINPYNQELLGDYLDFFLALPYNAHEGGLTMKGFGSRLKALREQKGLKQGELAELIGVKSGQVISNWENDLNRPDLEKLPLLCSALDTTASYLLDYYGNSENKASPAEISHIKKYRALDGHGKKMVDFTLNEETKRVEQEKANAQTYSGSGNILYMKPKLMPIHHYWGSVSAGLGNYLDDVDTPYDIIELPENEVPYGTDYALTVNGDSMEPEIPDRAIILVKETHEVPEGQIGVFLYDGDSLCKRLLVDHERRRVILESANEQYSDIIVNFSLDFKTLGRVLGYLDESGSIYKV